MAFVAWGSGDGQGWAADAGKLGAREHFGAFAGPATTAPTMELEQSAARFGTQSDIQFKGKTSLDGGVSVGFMAELSLNGAACPRPGPTCTGETTVDEVYISVSGKLGKVGLATQSGGGGDVTSMASYVTKYTRLNGLSFAAPRALGRGAGAAQPTVAYTTPRYGGVQLGVTLTTSHPYTPPMPELGILTPRGLHGQPQSPGGVNVGANFAHSFNRVAFKIGGTYLTGADDPPTPASLDDAPRWGAGAELGYVLPKGLGTLTLTGSYRDLAGNGWSLADSDDGPSSIWDAGLQYSLGRWSLAGYTIAGKSYAAEAGYHLGPGVQIAGGVQFWNMQTESDLNMVGPASALRDQRSTVVFIETALDF